MTKLPDTDAEDEDDADITAYLLENVVPLVLYNNWTDFVVCVYETQRLFNNLIMEGVELERTTQQSRPARYTYNFASPDDPPLPIFTGDCFHTILEQGPAVIKHLTRGKECAFTRLVAKILYNQCMRVVSAYSDMVYFHTCYHQNSDAEELPRYIHFDYEHLADLMKSSVQYAFSGLMPVNMCFSNRGFVAALMSKNFCVLDGGSKHTMSILEYQEFVLSIAMGLHNRIGGQSPLYLLDAELLRHVVCMLRTSPSVAMKEFRNRELWLF
jgi:hypothetical protein